MKKNLDWLVSRPIAHRGLHNPTELLYENTLSSCKEAIRHGFNIEIDLHPAKDGKPVVFHDLTLERMTRLNHSVRQLDSRQLQKIKVRNSTDHIPMLDELLKQVKGETGLVIELKGVANEDDGFVKSVVDSLKQYNGPVAIMSFHHWLLKDTERLAPQLPLGLIAEGNDDCYASHKQIIDKYNIDFISYNFLDLPCKLSREWKNDHKPLICWTIRTPQQMARAIPYCDQITFEGFDPDITEQLPGQELNNEQL